MVQVVVLIAAFAAGVVAQGGFYLVGHVLVAGLTVLAVTLGTRPRNLPWLLLAPCAALAVWALVRGFTADAPQGGLAAAGTLAGFVVPVIILSGLDSSTRERCADGILAVGTAVAVTAWVGVAWHSPRFVQLVENRLWRGSSTITYPNATAAVLAPLALLAIGLLVHRRPAPARAACAYLLLVGVGAALSRAGVIALAAGFVVLALFSGVPHVLARAVPLVLGAGIAIAALAPSFPAEATAHPALAGAGLLVGAAVVVGEDLLPRALSGRTRLVTFSGLTAMAGAAGWAVLRSGALQPILASRGNLDSSGRTGALHASGALIAAHPMAGWGVGVAVFTWDTAKDGASVALYAHDEYLQTIVDLGLVGGLLLLGLLAAAASLTWRGRPAMRAAEAVSAAEAAAEAAERGSASRPAVGLWAGAAAAVTCLAVHSGFDFLWHLAVLPMLGGLLVGLAAPAAARLVPGGEITIPCGPDAVRPPLQEESLA